MANVCRSTPRSVSSNPHQSHSSNTSFKTAAVHDGTPGQVSEVIMVPAVLIFGSLFRANEKQQERYELGHEVAFPWLS